MLLSTWLHFVFGSMLLCQRFQIAVRYSSQGATNSLIRLSVVIDFPDEYGRPFVILREQQAKARVKGLEAVRVSTISE